MVRRGLVLGQRERMVESLLGVDCLWVMPPDDAPRLLRSESERRRVALPVQATDAFDDHK